ncbi:MAG: hypothetical protein ACM3NF_06320 [Gemmatimonadota bacterium]
MTGRGLRSILQPVLFIGIAAMLHGILFLIPLGGAARRDAGTSRGIRVKTFVEGPRAAAPPAPAKPPPSPIDPGSPSVRADSAAPVAGSGGPTAGGGGTAPGDGGGAGGAPSRSEFGEYLAHLRSDDVQGWARRSANAARRGWKGSGAGAVEWGRGSGSGSGQGRGRGTGSGSGRGGGYLDPRVRMVITQYPLGSGAAGDADKGRNISGRFRQVAYPDLKVKQSEFTSGWWNVYIELWTTEDGRIAKQRVLRPETDGPLERIFVDQVKRELEGWTFEPGASEIHVDVRFYVE